MFFLIIFRFYIILCNVYFYVYILFIMTYYIIYNKKINIILLLYKYIIYVFTLFYFYLKGFFLLNPLTVPGLMYVGGGYQTKLAQFIVPSILSSYCFSVSLNHSRVCDQL